MSDTLTLAYPQVWNAATTLREDTKAEYGDIYAGDDPINSTDPTGLGPCSLHTLIHHGLIGCFSPTRRATRWLNAYLTRYDPIYRNTTWKKVRQHGLDAVSGCVELGSRSDEIEPPYGELARPLLCLIGGAVGVATEGGYGGSDNGSP